jgi:recombination associated protein RdgC
MWFKNIKVFRFSKPLGLTVEQIEEKLVERPFKPLGKTERHCAGWANAAGEDAEMLTHTVGAATMVRLREESKIMPSAAVNEALKKKAVEIERREGRKLYRKERDQLKDDIVQTMLPRAFSKTKDTLAFFTDEYLVIDTSSDNAAQTLMHHLRTALDTLPVVALTTKDIPYDVLTSWVSQGYGSHDFAVGEECIFFDPREAGSVIRCKGQDLQCDEIQAHLHDMKVSQVGTNWNDSVTGIIDQDLGVKRLKFADIVTSKANETEAEDAIQQFDQDFAVMSGTVLQLIGCMVEAMGGLRKVREVQHGL